MEGATAAPRSFQHLREHSIGLPQVLFQSITRMAPGFAMIAMAAVPVVILVYMLVSAACIFHYAVRRRGPFNPLLHLVMPIAGIVLFFFPLYYQFYKAPPTYPIKGANWVAIAWTVIGIAVTIWIVRTRPEKLADVDRVYVEDETVAAGERPLEPA